MEPWSWRWDVLDTPNGHQTLFGWWFGCHFLFSHILGIIIPIDFHIFQRGGPTTNQLLWWEIPELKRLMLMEPCLWMEDFWVVLCFLVAKGYFIDVQWCTRQEWFSEEVTFVGFVTNPYWFQHGLCCGKASHNVCPSFAAAIRQSCLRWHCSSHLLADQPRLKGCVSHQKLYIYIYIHSMNIYIYLFIYLFRLIDR